MQKLAITLFCLLFVLHARSQCNIISTSNKVCIGSTAMFSPSPVSVTDSLYVWNFGDGSNTNQPAPSYQYTSTGTFNVTLRIYSFGGAFCDAAPFPVKVLAKPVAFYKRFSAYAQCFEKNVFVFADSSKAGPSGAPISQHTFVYDDGAFAVEIAPFPAGTVSHTYGDTLGSKYRVVLEVKDTNGCLAQYIDSVVVHPRMPKLTLDVAQNIQCGYTDVVLANGGFFDASNTQKITWIMGNGDTLYSPPNPFNNLNYRYVSDSGVFTPRIIVQDKNGCVKDTVGSEVVCYSPDSNIVINAPAQCFRGNLFVFSNKSTWWNEAYWVFNGFQGIDTSRVTGTLNEVAKQFQSCGSVQVTFVLDFGGCRIVKDTQVMIYGPKAVISGGNTQPTHLVQCEPHDTVNFRLPDPNCYFKDSGIHFVWNFYDPFAPPCTTDTRRNINVGLNCNHSVDSIGVKHYYSQASAACYTPRLWVIDSISGCHDSASLDVRINVPDAGWDSTITPVRRGVYYKRGDPLHPCLPLISFYFDEMIPYCGPERVWLLPDSNCFPHVWKLVSSSGSPGLYLQNYSNKCTPGNSLTYGIVARNGFDRNGIACYDTAWYPLKLLDQASIPFKHKVLATNTCNPFQVMFSVNDSIRKDVARIVCNFGDNSPNYQKVFTLPGDTIIRNFIHTYAEDGRYPYVVLITSKSGCVFEFLDTLYLGKNMALANNLPYVCEYDSASFAAYASYYGKNVPDFWGDPMRAQQGKESVFWNFGDESTWYELGREARHKYAKPGVYQISIAYKDSTPGGCFDTIVSPYMRVQVTAVVKKILMVNDTFFCAPSIITYRDSSYVVLSDTFSSDTIIIGHTWNFGPDWPLSVLQNPTIYYPKNGLYQTKLTLKTEHGCVVDTTMNIAIVGPEPKFVIVGDTFGCAPYRVNLKNETGKQLVSWIWYFNDPLNQIYSTSSDTNMSFTYTKPGVYRIDLVGEDRIFNTTTSSYSNCSDRFPFVDPANGYHSRQITVLKTDTLVITSPDSVCEQQIFTVQASGTSQVSQVKWGWGDNTFNVTGILENGQHAYDTTGRFRIKLEPVITATNQCVLPAELDVDVLQPVADFTYDSSAYPKFMFTNRSLNAVQYVWDFGQPSSAQNRSADTDPVHNYGSENKRFTVCLMAFDRLGCWDSVCKMLPQRSSVKIPNVFTPGNNDDKNDAFDIEIEGWEKYELYMYNRWGTLVFEGHTDGQGNDGLNWDGRNKNDGEPCPEGVYYLIFKYKLLTNTTEEVYHGTVTLIRE